jgi:protein phosphatase
MLRAAVDSGGSPDAVLATVSEANRAIFAHSEAARHKEPGSNARWYGMGTTADVALFERNRAHLVHVGDGSIYRFREGHLEAQTTPHTLLNEYRGEVTDEQLAGVPTNVISRALGMRADLEIDRRQVDTLQGDIWLLCSDGLTALVPDDAIQAILHVGGSAAAIRTALTDAVVAAQRASGKDEGGVAFVVHVVSG